MPCDTPITYSIGNIDSRFQISQQEFKKDVDYATVLWDKLYQKPLFVYDPHAKLTVSMVYDKRQQLNSTINQLENQLDTSQKNLAPQKAEYEKEVADFNQQVAQLNSQVDYWNSRGGAPHDEYEKLKAEQLQLQQKLAQLHQMAQSLNQSAEQFNSEVGRLNNTIDSFNQTLSLQPEEGLYDGKQQTITIYLTGSQNELIHTLAHELGHARGLDHVAGADSIMYAYTSSSIIPDQQDIDELTKVCEKRSLIELLRENLLVLVEKLQALSTR